MSPSNREKDRLGQQGDFTWGERFSPPYPLSSDQEFGLVTRFLDQEKMWHNYFFEQRNKRDLTCIAVDFERGITFDFDPLTWQTDRADLVDSHQFPKYLSGLLVKTEFNQLEPVTNYFQTMVPLLPSRSPVIVFENKGPGYRQGLEARRIILKDHGLVKRKILVQAPTTSGAIKEQMVWRSRTPAEYKGKPVNLVDEGPKWRRKWVSERIQQAAENYRQAEVNPINAFEIGKQLRNSKNPPQDLGAAELGFGFELELLCGCQVKTTVRGAWLMVKECPDFPECEGEFLR